MNFSLASVQDAPTGSFFTTGLLSICHVQSHWPVAQLSSHGAVSFHSVYITLATTSQKTLCPLQSLEIYFQYEGEAPTVRQTS